MYTIEDQKLKCFLDLGFDIEESLELVEEGYDWHELDRLLKIKCPKHLAIKICAPMHSLRRTV